LRRQSRCSEWNTGVARRGDHWKCRDQAATASASLPFRGDFFTDSELEAAALLRDVAAGRVPRRLLLYGPEPLLIDEILDRLAAAIVPDPAAAGWNREVLYADTAAPEAIVSVGLTLPLLAGSRLIVVRGLAEVSAKAVDRLRAAMQAADGPEGWPVAGTTVALVCAGADRRAAALRLVPEAEQVEVRAPTGRAIIGWLTDRARAAGLTLAPDAAQALVTLVGEDVGRLVSELEKAALFVDEARGERRVSAEVVRALAGETRARYYWELTQALEAGKRADALRLLEQLLQAGDEPLVLLGCVLGYLRDLWRVLGGRAGGADAREIAGLLPRRRPDWAVERLVARAEAVGLQGTVAGVNRCFEVERALKTSTGRAPALLTALLADLTR